MESRNIDLKVYPPEYNENAIDFARALSWFSIEKDIWSFAINVYNKKVLGYINAIPVNDQMYERFCSGELLENDINASDIEDYDTTSSYNLIILSIAIRPALKDEESTITKGRIAEMLIMSFIYKVSAHNEGKNKLKKIAAFAWTEEGKKLCDGFCMKKADHSSAHFPVERRLRRGPAQVSVACRLQTSKLASSAHANVTWINV